MAVAVTSLFRALELGPASVVVPIYGMFIAGGFTLSVILLGEEITLAKSVGVVAAIQRSAVRNAAAAASGASTMLARLRAQSVSSGGQGEAGPTRAADAVATPKINTGT